jgi:preprotein translocase subunit SecA
MDRADAVLVADDDFPSGQPVSRRRRVTLASGAPYAERPDRRSTPLDDAIQRVFVRGSRGLASAMRRKYCERIAMAALAQTGEIGRLSDRRLLEQAEALRAVLRRTNLGQEAIARGFALAREAARRHCGFAHHPVQLMGGAAMMSGALAEMETGEGKTLTALLPAVVAALASRPVHVVTVNEYLAKRDSANLAGTFAALGLTVGLVELDQDPAERAAAYRSDVTYCTNKDLVFDYLRDRLSLASMRSRSRRMVREFTQSSAAPRQSGLLLRGLHFAIIDEADSVMIDEARTPLILSATGKPVLDNHVYHDVLEAASALRPGEEYVIDREAASVRLTPQGEATLQERFTENDGICAIRQAREELARQALSALHLFQREREYILAEGKVQIVDENTGRIMPDRAWEGGLHQFIEVKEGCDITDPRVTLARITYQRFFRRYLHLCGMTGTASEAATELNSVYGLSVIRIPTNRPLRRRDLGATVVANAEQKWREDVNSTRRQLAEGRAVLIGTRSVGASESLGALLSAAGLQPVVLNARQDKDEAEIVARAGRRGSVTVATNMAGRGTDIKPEASVLEAGGLHVILTEYHESARIDRQLFGRAGRQGDPGSFEAIVAASDDLFQRFGGAGGRLLVGIAGREKRFNGALPVLRRWCQAAAERRHYASRIVTLREDQRLQKALAFAGQSE